MEIIECQSCEADITGDTQIMTPTGDIFCETCYNEISEIN